MPMSDLPELLSRPQNLLGGGPPKEAELSKSKSRFEILDDKQLRSRSKKSMKSQHSSQSHGANLSKGKSFFGSLDSDEEDDDEEEERPAPKSGSGNMKKNKVSPTY